MIGTEDPGDYDIDGNDKVREYGETLKWLCNTKDPFLRVQATDFITEIHGLRP